MSTSVVIIEDEAAAAAHLRKVLGGLSFDHEVVKHLTSVEEAISWFSTQPAPDLVFADIQLSDGLVFEILDQVTLEMPIIFTTAYDQYAIKAFKTTGIDYLLKPITPDAVAEAVSSYQRKHAAGQDESWLKVMEVMHQHPATKPTEYTDRFLFRNGSALFPVQAKDIAWFARDQHVYACLFDGRRFVVDQSLDQLQRALDPSLFYRLSRTVMAQPTAIVKLEASAPGKLAITLEPPHQEPLLLSQERSSWLRKRLSGEG